MTDQLSPLAVQNAPLLRALQDGGAASPTELAEKAGILPNHVHRKLDALEDEGLILRAAHGRKHEATLSPAAERTLLAIDVFDGKVQAGEGDVVEIPLMKIDRSPLNPRRHFDDATVMEMAQSIADKGILQPIVVRPVGPGRDFYHVIIGERRWRGANAAVRERWVPSDFKIPCRVRDYTDQEALEVAGVENLQREDLHWMDEAQFYWSLVQSGRSASQIERLVGGTRGKRSIQDYSKIARELSAEDVARTYLPEGDKSYLPYVRARDLVGDKKERPALDLTPKLKLTFLELIRARQEQMAPLVVGAQISTNLFAAPVGGPMGTLASDRKLISFGFDGSRQVVCRIKITDEVAKYLAQTGFLADEFAVLHEARAAVIGEMQAAALEPAEFVTPELNRPKSREPQPQITFVAPEPRTPEPTAPPGLPPAEHFDEDGEEDDPVLPPTIHRAGPEVLSGDGAGSSLPPFDPEPVRTAPPATEPKSLAPMLQIVVIELAHRIASQGVERGPGTWATEVLANYYKDARGGQLVQQHKMLAFMPMGQKTLAALTKGALEWLREALGTEVDALGRVLMSDSAFLALQRELGFTPEAGIYSTFWLNDPAEAPAPEAPALERAAAPAPAARTGGYGDTFSRQIQSVTAVPRALERLTAAAKEAGLYLTRLKTVSKPKPEELSQVLGLLNAAIEQADAAISAEADRG